MSPSSPNPTIQRGAGLGAFGFDMQGAYSVMPQIVHEFVRIQAPAMPDRITMPSKSPGSFVERGWALTRPWGVRLAGGLAAGVFIWLLPGFHPPPTRFSLLPCIWD